MANPGRGGSTRMDEGARPADKSALSLLDPRIGIFCDNTRDTIKGGVFNAKAPGVCQRRAGRRLHAAACAGALSRDGADGFTRARPLRADCPVRFGA